MGTPRRPYCPGLWTTRRGCAARWRNRSVVDQRNRSLDTIGRSVAVLDQPIKRALYRQRPDRLLVPEGRRAPLRHSSSFPSGHTASAVAFGTWSGVACSTRQTFSVERRSVRWPVASRVDGGGDDSSMGGGAGGGAGAAVRRLRLAGGGAGGAGCRHRVRRRGGRRRRRCRL